MVNIQYRDMVNIQYRDMKLPNLRGSCFLLGLEL